MTTPQEERSESPSLLLMISDAADLDAAARSKHRQVRRWVGDAGPPVSGEEFTGDPTDAQTYEWISDARAVTAIVHLRDDARAEAVVDALRKVRPDSAMLVLSKAIDHAPGDGTLSRPGALRDVLRLDLEDELLRLESERRAWCLKQFVDGCEVVPILVHPDPDPDAISSALALRALLHRDERTAPLVATGPATRPENRRMLELLKMTVEVKTSEPLNAYERVIVIDMQPARMPKGGPRFAVIDHHPAESEYCSDFIDVRPEYGATATMMTQYLQAVDDKLIDERLATALLFGIRTDTDLLARGVSPADVAAYAFLQSRIDTTLLRRMEKPSIPPSAAQAFGRALCDMVVDDDTVYAYAGALEEESKHVLADTADYCMEIEGVVRAVVAGDIGDNLIITLRETGAGKGVATLARALGERGGSGGGHELMARAVVPLAAVPRWSPENGLDALIGLVKEAGDVKQNLSRRS